MTAMRQVRGMNVVAGVGNNGGSVGYPARFSRPVLGVGSATGAGAPCGYSNRGPGLDISQSRVVCHARCRGRAVAQAWAPARRTPRPRRLCGNRRGIAGLSGPELTAQAGRKTFFWICRLSTKTQTPDDPSRAGQAFRVFWQLRSGRPPSHPTGRGRSVSGRVPDPPPSRSRRRCDHAYASRATSRGPSRRCA